MLLLLTGASMRAQSIAAEQMDERFNDGTKMPYGWFAEAFTSLSSQAAQQLSTISWASALRWKRLPSTTVRTTAPCCSSTMVKP